MIYCTEHGPSQFCFVNPDGIHVDASLCRCKPIRGILDFHRWCPVEEHKAEYYKRDARAYEFEKAKEEAKR